MRLERSAANLATALIAFLTFSTVVPDASAQVVLPGTQPGELVNWPLEPAGNCQACHGDYVPGEDYEPFDTWSGSMMANAARDPLFWAAVDIANQDVPGIGEFCIRCHSPQAWLAGRSSTPDGSAMLGYPDETNNDFDGVDCHFCHRMVEGTGPGVFTQNGQYFLDDGTPSQEPPRYGPYDDAFAPHPTAQSNYTTSSEFCGTCHDLTNPLVELLDANGNSTGLDFPEQLTYTEWAQSAFAAEDISCQDCHMPDAGVDPAFACNSFTPARPQFPGAPGVSRHDLVGANTFVPAILAGEYGAALGREAAYAYTIARANEMLQQRSATLEVSAPTLVAVGDSAAVAVRVTNITGHKLPTGYPEGRRMWLHVRVTDATGATVFESGAYDAQTAILDEDPQLRIYEARHGQHGGGVGFHLVLNDRIYFDSRIPPRGFVPVPGSEPVGIDYAVQPGGALAHWDDAPYRFAVPAGVQGPLAVSATLRYQTASREYIEFLRDENVSGPDPQDRDYPNAPSRGEKIHSLWSSYGKSAPVDMVSDAASMDVVTPPAGVTNLAAVSGHNRVRLSWTLPGGATGAKLLRKAWGGYPEYASAGGTAAPSFPANPTDALATGWVEIYDGALLSFEDGAFDNTSRDVYSYAAFAYDSMGVFALGQADSRVRAASYRLGDLGMVGSPSAYDGLIDGALDLPVFSLAYGSAPGAPGWNPEVDMVDMAPTTGASELPQPDDRVDFDDLVLFSLRFGTVDPLTKSVSSIVAQESEPFEGQPARVVIGPGRREGNSTVFAVVLEASPLPLRALHLEFVTPHEDRRETGLGGAEVRTPNSGPQRFAGTVRRTERLDVDVAMMDATGGASLHGHVADLVVHGDFDGSWFELGRPRAHALDGKSVSVVAAVVTDGPTSPVLDPRAVTLSANVPNPFNPRTRLELRLDRSAATDVGVYDLAGRRLHTLVQGVLDAGVHELVWGGTDDAQREVASGVYLVRASALGETVIRRVVLVR